MPKYIAFVFLAYYYETSRWGKIYVGFAIDNRFYTKRAYKFLHLRHGLNIINKNETPDAMM